MSFDLILWKAAAAPTAVQAHETFQALLDGDVTTVIESADLPAFWTDLEARFPWLGDPDQEPTEDGFEFERAERHAWLGIPWVVLPRVGPVVEELARRHELLLFDPQSGEAHLPPSLGPASPIDWNEAAAPGTAVLDALTPSFEPIDWPADASAGLEAAMRRLVEEHGLRVSRPGGRIVGSQNLDDVGSLFRLPGRPPFVEPFPVEAHRQTPKRLAALQRELDARPFTRRNVALLDLGGWAPTEEVIDTVRGALIDSDPSVRGYAVHALGHLGDLGSAEGMVRIALDLVDAQPVDFHGIDLAAEGAMAAVHGCVLLELESEHSTRLRQALPRMRSTGASFSEQLVWLEEHLL